VRELREFRVHHAEYQQNGLAVAGVTRDTVKSNRTWSKRLSLPYPLLSDPDGQAGRSLGVVRRIPIGAWKIDLFRRSTYLIDLHGVVAAVWRDVKIRGHAAEVLDVARALAHPAP
jgi:thioredoxin-dependent peroxiredoxin